MREGTEQEALLTPHRSDDGEPWRLVQIASLLRRSDDLHRSALSLLVGVDADIDPNEAVELSAHDVSEIETFGADIAELASQLQLLTETLSATPAKISAPGLRADAERALAEGSFDPQITLLAARALPAARGWPALAGALRCTDAHTTWHHMTVAQLLTAFRDTDAAVTQHAIRDAALAPDTELSTCDRDDVTRLARALQDHADHHR